LNRDDIVGVYRQIGEETVKADGTAVSGGARNSQIMYSPDGYMAVISGPADRNRVAGADGAPNLDGATEKDRAEAARGMVCYAGRYELKDDEVHHLVDMALNPNVVGRAIVRRVHLAGADLTLSTLPDAQGTVRRILWRRVVGKQGGLFGRLCCRVLTQFRDDFLR
jgi:hypothetical protein